MATRPISPVASLTSLVEDILLHLFTLCGIPGVLAASQASRPVNKGDGG